MARSARFYLPGTGSYDADRAKELRRQRREAKQALASAKRAKAGPDAIRKAKQRTARIERELGDIAGKYGIAMSIPSVTYLVAKIEKWGDDGKRRPSPKTGRGSRTMIRVRPAFARGCGAGFPGR